MKLNLALSSDLRILSQLLLGLPPCVSYLLRCNKPPQHLKAYNSDHSLAHEPAIWAELSGDSLSLPHLASGGAGAFACKMTHSSGFQVGASYCWEFSRLWVGGFGPSPCGLLHRPFGFSMPWHWVPRSGNSREPDRSYINFYDLALEVTECHSVLATIPPRFSRMRINIIV